jgi:anti-anti-sigma factor
MSEMKFIKRIESGTLCLEGELEIYEAEPLRDVLLEYLNASQDLVLDLEKVTACDMAGAQLLCSTRYSAAQAGKSFRITHVPDVVEQAWSRLGLPQEFLTHE